MKKDKVEQLKDKVEESVNEGDFEKALNYQKKINKIDPDDIDNIENLTGLYLKLERFEEALEIIERFSDDCWVRYLLLGHYHHELKEKEDALKNYLKAYELNPKNRKPLLNLVFHYNFEDDFEKSSEYAYKMLELDKRDIDALTLLISTFFHTYQFDKVIEYSEWALDISDERDADICSSLAFSYLMMGERQKGWDILVDATFKHPEDSAYYYTILASYLYATNEDEKAMQTYELAIKKDPSRPEPYLNLAMHYKSKEGLEKAKKYYDMYVERENFYVMGFDEF